MSLPIPTPTSRSSAHPAHRLGLGLLAVLLSMQAQALDLYACGDDSLATLGIEALHERFRQSGAEDCQQDDDSWGSTLRCERVHGAKVAGIRVKELSAEVHAEGQRSLQVVLDAAPARVEAELARIPRTSGQNRSLQAREDGTTSLRCITREIDTLLDADRGAIRGVLPALPPGATGWQVCAMPAQGEPVCRTADAVRLAYRIADLSPGSYGILATPIGAVDPLLRAMLIESQPLGETADGGPKVLAAQVNVRTGVETQATELRLLRLPAQR